MTWKLGFARALALAVCALAVPVSGTGAQTSVDDAALAAAFRPLVYFDHGEHWRPMSVDSIVADQQVMVCATGKACVTAESPKQIAATAGGHLDIAGQISDPSSYRSVEPGCVAGVLLDCDSGASSHVYYRVSTHGAYRYLDYWLYYRFNDAPTSRTRFDDHESDWEGLTVAVPTTAADPRTFDFVQFAAHRGVYRYLRSALLCGHAASSCGADAKRVLAFVARGTHASYPEPCAGVAGYCRQNTMPWLENSFDGKAGWGANDDNAALSAFPTPGWTTWPGAWDPGSHVFSPGAQNRYKAPWNATCVTRWHKGIAGTCLTPAGEPDPCATWFGPFTTAVVCNAGRIAKGLAKGGLKKVADVIVGTPSRHVASVGGLSQAIGAPLVPGDDILLKGSSAPSSDTLYVRVQTLKYTLLARFDETGLYPTGRSAVRVDETAKGVPTAEIVRLGKFRGPPPPIQPAATRLVRH